MPRLPARTGRVHLRLCYRNRVYFCCSGRSYPSATHPWIPLPIEYATQRRADTRRWAHTWPTCWYLSCVGGAQHDTHRYRVSDHAGLHVSQCFCLPSWRHYPSTTSWYPFRAYASAGTGSERHWVRCLPHRVIASLRHLSTGVCGVEVVLLLLLIMPGNKEADVAFLRPSIVPPWACALQ